MSGAHRTKYALEGAAPIWVGFGLGAVLFVIAEILRRSGA